MEEVKILHCLHSLSWGGLEIYTVQLIEKMQQAGFRQKVLCSSQSPVYEELKKKNIPIISFSGARISKFRQAKLIRKILTQEHFTHIHSHARLDMWAAALALWNRTDVRHFYNLYMNATPKKDFIHKWLFSKVDVLCSSSENILNDVKRNFPIDFKKLHLVRYGRDSSLYFSQPEVRKQLRGLYGAKSTQLILGTLCRIDPGKGVRELVRTLEYLNDQELAQLQLWIIGDPTTIGKNPDGSAIYEEPALHLQQWLDNVQQNPRYKGHLIRIPFQKNYISYLDALDVFALASYNETYSLSVLDAMLMKKPVIGTDSGGTPEQIGANERGLLAEPQDAKSLALCISHYLKHPEDIQIQGIKAEAWVRATHEWDQVINQYRELYQRSLQRSPSVIS